jgi:hypothetical protein
VAVRFDASNEFYTRTVTIGTVSAFTVCCWVKISTDRNNFSTVWCLDNNSTLNYQVLQTNTDGTTLMLFTDSGSQRTVGALSVGTWYFVGVAVSGTGGTIKLRAEGAPSFTTINITGGDSSTNITRLRLGESVFGGEWLNGCLASVKVWTAALSASELEAEYPAVDPVRTSNLFAFYRFTGPSTTDDSGNGQTLSGGSGASQEPGPELVTPVEVTGRSAAGLAAHGAARKVAAVTGRSALAADGRVAARRVVAAAGRVGGAAVSEATGK